MCSVGEVPSLGNSLGITKGRQTDGKFFGWRPLNFNKFLISLLAKRIGCDMVYFALIKTLKS
jgi:hypothetical protein